MKKDDHLVPTHPHRDPEERSPEGPSVLRFGDFRLDRKNRLLFRGDVEIQLGPKGIQLLDFLARHAEEVCTKTEILDEVWPDAVVSEHTLVEAVRVVRKALADEPQEPEYIQTVHRRGYRFVAQVRSDELPTPEEGSGARDQTGVETTSESPDEVPALAGWAILAGGMVVIVSVGLAAFTWGTWQAVAPSGPSLRVPVTLPVPLAPGPQPNLALSPDGSRLAFVGRRNGVQLLYVMGLDRLGSKPLETTAGSPDGPFFSPDGTWVGYFDRSAGRLMKVSVSAGPAVELAPIQGSRPGGASWGSDGYIYFSHGPGSGLWRVGEEGGDAELLASPDRGDGEYSFLDPYVGPGAKTLVFSVEHVGIDSLDKASIALLSLGPDRRRVVLDAGGSKPHLLPGGDVVFGRGASILVLPVDPEELRALGSARPLLEGVLSWPRTREQFSVAPVGTLAYVRGSTGGGDQTFVWAEIGGDIEPVKLPGTNHQRHALSPDGDQVALSFGGDVWVKDLERGTSTRMTSTPSNDIWPLWLPDGRRLVFNSNRTGPYGLYLLDLVTGSVEELLEGSSSKFADSVSRQGDLLVYTEENPRTGYDLWKLRLDDPDATPSPLLRTQFDEMEGKISPRGGMVAYSSNESGDYEIFVRALGDASWWRQVSVNGGRRPVWAPGGERLFFTHAGQIWAVSLDGDGRDSFGPPRAVYETRQGTAAASGPFAHAQDRIVWYDVDPGGGRFLVAERSQTILPRSVVLIQQGIAEQGVPGTASLPTDFPD